MSKNKKALKIILTFVIIGVFLFMVPFLFSYGSILKEALFDRPSRPRVEYGEFPFECQVSVIYYLNIFNIGVIGLPVIVGKNCRICGILPLARIGGKQGVRKIHLCVELTTGDNVIIACSRIGKPREGSSEQHRDV